MRRIALRTMGIGIFLLTQATAAGALDWHWPMGMTYLSGHQDIVDIYEDNLHSEGYYTQTSDSVPVGISFHPYAVSSLGLGGGASVGPIVAILGDRDFLDIPLGLDFRYVILPTSGTSPYLRVGGRIHLVSGDYVEDTTPGAFGAVGVEILRDRKITLAFEASYDSAEIELESARNGGYETVTPGGFMLSALVVL